MSSITAGSQRTHPAILANMPLPLEATSVEDHLASYLADISQHPEVSSSSSSSGSGSGSSNGGVRLYVVDCFS